MVFGDKSVSPAAAAAPTSSINLQSPIKLIGKRKGDKNVDFRMG